MVSAKKSEGSMGLMLGGLVMMAIFGFLTWLQIERINEESYWIIFRVWFIPIPIILFTALGSLGGLVVFFQGLVSGFRNLLR